MSHRPDQVASLLEHQVSEILARDFEAPEGSMVTVMRAEVSPDLKTAKIFVSVLPENRTGSALEALRKQTRDVQRQLNSALSMKFFPRITWELDVTTRKYAAVDEALKK